MKAIQLLMVLFIICITLSANGQSMERQVISANGSSVSTGTLQLDYTFGGLVVTTSPVTSSFQISSGYNQTRNLVTVSVLNPDGNIEAKIFSNPVKDFLILETNIDIQSSINYEIIDELGRGVLRGKALKGETQISLKDLAAAQYFLKLSSANQEQQTTIPFIKQ